jgi:hypothetical protein
VECNSSGYSCLWNRRVIHATALLPVSLQARAEAEVLWQECHDLQDQLQRREAQLTVAHAAHDEALERLKAHTTAPQPRDRVRSSA